MPKLQVSRETEIDRPLADVAPLVREFRHWPAWSPWLVQERDAELHFEGSDGEVGSSYSWHGQRVGAGEMRLVAADDRRFDYQLQFLRPFRSKADVRIELTPVDAWRTRVVWRMDSSLPLIMFYLRKAFETFIGLDYERGLRMLGELAEEGAVHSNIEALQVDTLPATDYLARDGEGRIADLGPIMEAAYPALRAAADAAGLDITGPPFAHYRVMDPVKDRWVFTMGLPVSGEAVAEGVERRTREALPRCATLVHQGRYHHLGNGWAALFGWVRADRLKHKRKLGGYEIYLSDPDATPDAERRVQLSLPIR